MTKPLKIFLFVLGASAAALVAIVVGLLLFFDINRYKPEIEAKVSSVLGMQVAVEGKLALALSPGFRVTLQNVRIRNRDTDLAFVPAVDVAIPFLALLGEEVRPSDITAKGARILIERNRAGKYNYEKLPSDVERSRPLNLPKVAFRDLTVVYSDQQPEDRLELNRCDGELNDMQNPGGEPLLKHLSLNGAFKCDELKGPGTDKNRVVTDVKFNVVAKAGIFDIDPITVKAYGGLGTAKIRVDRSLDVPTISLSATLPKFRVESLLRPTASGKSLSGLLTFSANLSMSGSTRLAMRQSAHGDMSLSGTALKLSGVDLDQQLQKFELSQNLNLLDVGALLFVGPISFVVTKGAELANLAQPTSSGTSIRNVISRWKLEKGVAHAVDVGLTTNENRLAVQGDLNFVSDQYQDIIVALIDENGCAKARQKVSGPFAKPIADQSNILLPVGPLLRLLDSAKALLSGGRGKCEVFYSGSLPSPA